MFISEEWLTLSQNSEQETKVLEVINTALAEKFGNSIKLVQQWITIRNNNLGETIFCPSSDCSKSTETIKSDLTERIKELNCLHNISELIDTKTPKEVYTSIPYIVQHSWQYPKITASKLNINNTEFSTDNFPSKSQNTRNTLRQKIFVEGEQVGFLEIVYLEDKPDAIKEKEDYTDSQGPFMGFEVALIKNITERLGKLVARTQDQQELQQTKNTLETIYNNSPDMQLSTDDAGKIVECNETFLKKLGYNKEEIIGQSISDLLTPINQVIFENTILPEFEKSGEIRELELRIQSKNWQPLTVKLNVSAVRDQEGNITHSVSTLKDISETVELEFQLRQAQKMEAIGTLAGGVAHNFNNSLQIIIGNIELILLITDKDNPLYPYLQEIQKASRNATETVKELVSFSRHQEIPLKKEPVSITIYLKETLKLLKNLIPPEFEINIDIPQNPYSIEADVSQIQQVIMNIVVNAYHAMKPQGSGKIDISIENTTLSSTETSLTPGNYLKINISDTGNGIAKENINKVFDPFFTTKDQNEGTGLGLATAYGSIKNHKGQIKVYNKPAKTGAIFEILLPAYNKKIKKNISKESNELPWGNETILIIDDKKAITQILRKQLERLWYEIITCNDPTKALEQDISSFDMVITDIGMPRIPGNILSQKILKEKPQMPILMCTGYIDNETTTSINDSQKVIMTKPINYSNLAHTVRNVLDENANK